MVLVITSPNDATANMVIASLNQRGAPVTRVDPADIGPSLQFGAYLGGNQARWSGRLITESRDVALEDVRAIYHRRPSRWRFRELEGPARDFAVAEARHGLGGLLGSLGCRYVNHPEHVAKSDFKPSQLRVAASLGLTIPATLITNDLDAVRRFAVDHTSLIYKSFRGYPHCPDGTAAAVWTQRVEADEVDESVTLTAHLFQEEVAKEADARVTVVGRRVFAQKITSPAGELDWRRDDWDTLVHTPIEVPSPIVAGLYGYLDRFDLVFGCFDFALEATGDDADPYRWIFIECNPNGQWGWLPDSDAIADAFADTLLEGWFS
ncbi:ATP-grasp ribosomal peptide maturase [Sphaerisporangium sp. NPDC051011]|uniref:ATP-grasp ribosomal peptide maturase n=1 Tax=Sphaerisporangium sp. NPDC051011 TaxID=3155792 RepID=UPI0033C0ADF7